MLSMKKMKIQKFGFILILALLFSFYPIKAVGVTRPILESETLLRGQSTRFSFQIQAAGSPTKLFCTYSTPELDPLIVTFDEPSVEVDIDEIKYIHGTLSVPADAPIKTYSGMFSISCNPIDGGGEGSTIKQVTTIFFPSVNVVERTTTVPEERVAAAPYSLTTIVLIIVIIVIVAIYWFQKSKKKK